ncbi:Alpha/Beta hydrolase protein [Aspergillus leporis]|uniref:Alpha/Beta hydrolase protein n=1 Tax=Aspergillus leporis TaxID=41062 RepID=A0A5N5WJ92_9EURO|nr:Alpha/Beta hydrolase protein [Aspergillus leporis]
MSLLYRWFGPVYDAILCPSLPFGIRWRLLALQPIVLLTNTIQYWRGLRSKHPKTTIWIPLKRAPGHSVRAIVYHPREKASQSKPRALHLNIHGGGFLGGLPEGNTPFCERVAAETGAVVVSTSHQYAPRYTFPVAHENVQDVAEWLIENSERLWGADPKMMSVSGFSAGGNLALGVAQWLARSEFNVKAAVMFYAPVDLRLPPWEKPKPANFPEKDPLAFVLPLMDAYAGPEREKYRDSPLLHPILADIESMPRNMLFIAGKVDILLHEQTVFVNRLKDEAAVLNRKIRLSTEASGENPTDEVLENVDSLTARPGTATQHPYYHIQGMFFDDQIHGWIELPSMAIDTKLRDQVYDDAVRFLDTVYTHPR